MDRRRSIALVMLRWLFFTYPAECGGFLIQPLVVRTRALIYPHQQQLYRNSSPLFTTSTTSTSNPIYSEIEGMKAGQIKQELESYGINTKSFLEKSELVAALTDARARGLQPKKPSTPSEKKYTTSSSSGSGAGSSDTSTSSANSRTESRETRIVEEMARLQSTKASDLKKELIERGISTANSFFEKSEFVRAVAEARIDGIVKRKSSTSSSEKSGDDGDGGYAEYSNVEVLTDDASGPRRKQSTQNRESQSSNPFEGIGNPFGGGATGSPFGGMGGMGGMGGIADMLKNMGMGGMGGGSSGGGGSANPFGAGMGGVMGKAQELMKNPKVMEIMQKAQSNPRIMAKVNECISNPASFVKYQNDPEVAELIGELKKYM